MKRKFVKYSPSNLSNSIKAYNSGSYKRRKVPYSSYKPKVNLRSIIKYQQSRSGGEIKSVDIINPNPNAQSSSSVATPATFPLNSTVSITLLNGITIGSSAWNRVGRKLSLKSVHLVMNPIIVNASTAVQYARIAIVYDKQTNGALPSYDDMFRDNINASTDCSTSSVVFSYAGINLNNRDRFEIIADKRFMFPSSDTANFINTSQQLQCYEYFYKLGDRETHYKADSAPGVIGDVATGSLLLVTWGNVAAGSEAYGVQIHARIRYTDL
nr:MAG: capsid protein [Cressdnaviricota sp.]